MKFTNLFLLATLALCPLSPAAIALDDCDGICSDSCCECAWVVRVTHDDPIEYIDKPYNYEQRDPYLSLGSTKGFNDARKAGFCTPTHFFGEAIAKSKDGNPRSTSGSTARLLKRVKIRHVNTCDACSASEGRADIDAVVGFGIFAEITPKSDSVAGASGYMSIIEARSGVAAEAEGTVSVSQDGWKAWSMTGSLIGGSGGIGGALGGTESGYFDQGSEFEASEAFSDSGPGNVERNSFALRFRAQVPSISVETVHTTQGIRRAIPGYDHGGTRAYTQLKTTTGEAHVVLSCDNCGHTNSKKDLHYFFDRPDAGS